jgi:hypothetical protein
MSADSVRDPLVPQLIVEALERRDDTGRQSLLSEERGDLPPARR